LTFFRYHSALSNEFEQVTEQKICRHKDALVFYLSECPVCAQTRSKAEKAEMETSLAAELTSANQNLENYKKLVEKYAAENSELESRIENDRLVSEKQNNLEAELASANQNLENYKKLVEKYAAENSELESRIVKLQNALEFLDKLKSIISREETKVQSPESDAPQALVYLKIPHPRLLSLLNRAEKLNPIEG
jgi:DNA repair exonuclease SbcCD ATPase subunit